MEQIIYSKFSNERNRDLAIRTDILQDETGKRVVRKMPLFDEGKVHVLKSLEWEKRLSEKYQDTCIRMNHGEQDGDGIRFEYLEGKTLETVLDDLYMDGNYEKLLEVFRQYVDWIKKANGTKQFRVTDDFEKVFGPVWLSKEFVAADVNNIDMVVGNIIVQNDTWNVIDYEWTFDFPIPVNYIIFRTIFYYVYATAKREELKDIGFYRIFGISEKEQAIYLQMEDAFQRYIISDITPIRNMYSRISMGSIGMEELLQMSHQTFESRKMQVYFDCGEGFSEQNSIWIYPQSESDSLLKYNITLKEDVRAVRIDPSNDTCLLSIKKLIGKSQYDYELNYNTNAVELWNNIHLFACEDPQVCIADIMPGTYCIQLDAVKEAITEEFAKGIRLGFDKTSIAYKKYLNDQELLGHQARVELPMRIQQVAELNHRVYMAEKSFHEIQGSFCWKITKPIRIIMGIIKPFFNARPGLKKLLKNVKRFLIMGPRKTKEYNANERLQKRSFHIQDELKYISQGEENIAGDKPVGDAIMFSVVMCVKNTPEITLRKAIESVLSQTYDCLELCIVNQSDKKHKYVRNVVRDYACYDSRVRYNKGIADAKGQYLVMFSEDAFMHPSLLYKTMQRIETDKADFIYTDEAKMGDVLSQLTEEHHKPQYSPDYLRSMNYIGKFFVVRKELYQMVGGFDLGLTAEARMYDLVLKISEQATEIVRIPQILFYHQQITADTEKGCPQKEVETVVARHLQRIGLAGTVETSGNGVSRIKYDIVGEPLISIIIPNKDHLKDLKRCIESILDKSTYGNYEIIIVENNSELKETFEYYQSLDNEAKVKVVYWEKGFNYAAITNYGAEFANGDYYVLLNNDIEVIEPDWMQEMLMYAQREDVGAVGAKLYYPNDQIQHAGVIIGLGGVAGHAHKMYSREDQGYFNRLIAAQNLSAVTAACLMVRKDVFEEVHGLNEKYQVAYNDVDFCLKIRKAGYLIVYSPYVEMYHCESISRGTEDTPEKMERFMGEMNRLKRDWKKEIAEGDPYYNPNLTHNYEDFRLKKDDILG